MHCLDVGCGVAVRRWEGVGYGSSYIKPLDILICYTAQLLSFMLFQDLLEDLSEEVNSAVSEFFEAAWENQTHPQDLLLVDQHGFYSEELAKPSIQEKHHIGPYVIGPGRIGFGEATFYEFIDWYRQSHLWRKAEFEGAIEEDEKTRKQEKLTVQLEQSIYLRFWEAEALLKQYYQLALLASGEPYDWHFEVPSHAREGSKHELIRKKIRDRVQSIYPKFYSVVKNNYLTQIRNAIAHSQFYITGRAIRFLNYSQNPAAHTPLQGMAFDEWYRMFHTTVLLHNATIGAFKWYRQRYKERTLKDGNRIQIRIIDDEGTKSTAELGVLHDRDEWIWQKNLRKEDLNQ